MTGALSMRATSRRGRSLARELDPWLMEGDSSCVLLIFGLEDGGLIVKSYLTRIAALAVASLIATPLIAEEASKVGTFKIKGTATGSLRYVTIGNGESHLDVFEETGKVEGEGLLSNMTTRCFSVGETVQSVSETPHGHCIYRDADGDQVVYRTGVEKHPQERATIKGWGEAMLGTGKYAGIVASYVVVCNISGPGSGYTNECEGEGSYILP
jgi:hypothetical protein